MDETKTLLGDVVAWDNRRLVITSPAAVAKLRRKSLSPSTAKSLSPKSCAGNWAIEKLLPRRPENPFDPAPLGTSAHALLEDFYGLDPAGRTLERFNDDLRAAAWKMWPDHSDEPNEVRAAVRTKRREWAGSVRAVSETIFTMEDPAQVDVYATEMKFDGLEVGGVPAIGFIDRVDNMPDGGIKPLDYKGLAIDTPIPTPSGWTTMGNLRVGDLVLGTDGHPTAVTVKSQTHHRKCYEVTFSDGSTVVCDNVHLWEISSNSKTAPSGNSETIEADALYERVLEKIKNGQPIKLHIENSKPLSLPHVELPIDPWVLGAWLGDGVAKSSSLCVGPDGLEDMLGLVREAWGEPSVVPEGGSYMVGLVRQGVKPDELCTQGAVKRRSDVAASGNLAVMERVEVPYREGLRTKLGRMGLVNNKHVPAEYLRASREQRLSLLQGLMDTDGSFNPLRGRAVFVNTNRDIANAVRELVLTLGVTVQWFEKPYANKIRPDATVFMVEFRPIGFNPFRLKRKADLVAAMQPKYNLSGRHIARVFRRGIVGMRIVDSVPTECIAVDAPNSLYLCGPTMIPTHNTGKEENLAYGDTHGDQLRIYAEVARLKTGVMPTAAEVYYTKTGLIRPVNIGERAMDDTLVRFSQSWDRHNRFLDNAEFTLKESALCGWCPAVNSCPVAAEKGKTDRKGDAHSAVALGIPTLRNGATPTPAQTARDFDLDFPPEDVAETVSDPESSAHMDVEAGGDFPEANEILEENAMRITEGRPYEDPITAEGELDPNNYATMGVFSITQMAVEALHIAGRGLSGREVSSLAHTFAWVVSRAQQNWIGEGAEHNGFALGSHARLRNVLRTVIVTLPLPFGEDEAGWADWADKAVKRANSIVRVSLDVFSNPINDEPWARLAGGAAAVTAAAPAVATPEPAPVEPPKAKRAPAKRAPAKPKPVPVVEPEPTPEPEPVAPVVEREATPAVEEYDYEDAYAFQD